MGMPVITTSGTPRNQAITDIIQSVALEQAALAHILNAEGEKLQKVIANTSDQEKLLDINRSVEKMVNAVSRLELILQSKLEIFEDCISNDCLTTSTTTTTTTTTRKKPYDVDAPEDTIN